MKQSIFFKLIPDKETPQTQDWNLNIMDKLYIYGKSNDDLF